MLTFAVRLILEDNGKLLFLRQTKKNGGRYSLVGGNVENDEFARQALSREAMEEAGVDVDPKSMRLVHVLHRHKLKKNKALLVLYFKATAFKGTPASREPKKFADAVWLDKEKMPLAISKPTRHVLQMIRQNIIYSEFPTRDAVLAFWEQFGHQWTDPSDS
ncbi:MAG: NUDIX hydrolase [Saprospiraceae bacterium]